MALPRTIADLAGTALSKFGIGFKTARIYLKAITGGIAVRNTADSADAELTASKLMASGDSIQLNSDAAGSAADWKYNVNRPASGMAADVDFTLPPDEGSPGQVLQTDGSGNTSWQTAATSATNIVQTDDTALAFGDSSPVPMFTKPAGAKVKEIRVYVDTPFNGTNPTLSIGITGTVSKYMGTGDVDLTTAGIYTVTPDVDVVGGTEALIATYSAGSSSAGAARIETDYVVPN